MNSESKTTEDILREMREYADQLDNDGDITGADFRDFANQLEAAMKREKAVTDAMLACKDKMAPHPDPDNAPPRMGNAAALREALSDACYAMFNFLKTQGGGYEEMAIALDKAKAALAAPPRNCDRFKAADEARMAFWDTHETIWDAFKNRGGTELFYEVLDWLFAPAEGKEASNG